MGKPDLNLRDKEARDKCVDVGLHPVRTDSRQMADSDLVMGEALGAFMGSPITGEGIDDVEFSDMASGHQWASIVRALRCCGLRIADAEPRYGPPDHDWAYALLADTKITFSRYCCSGIISLLGKHRRCQCFRCRKARGLKVTPASERLSAKVSAEAQAAMKKSLAKGWAAGDIAPDEYFTPMNMRRL